MTIIIALISSEAHAVDSTSFNPTSSKVRAMGGIPIGTIIVWPSASDPIDANKWLECDGRAVDSAKYPKLYEMMHNTPNMVNRFVRAGTADKVLVTGEDAIASHNITIPSHTHAFALEVQNASVQTLQQNGTIDVLTKSSSSSSTSTGNDFPSASSTIPNVSRKYYGSSGSALYASVKYSELIQKAIHPCNDLVGAYYIDALTGGLGSYYITTTGNNKSEIQFFYFDYSTNTIHINITLDGYSNNCTNLKYYLVKKVDISDLSVNASSNIDNVTHDSGDSIKLSYQDLINKATQACNDSPYLYYGTVGSHIKINNKKAVGFTYNQQLDLLCIDDNTISYSYCHSSATCSTLIAKISYSSSSSSSSSSQSSTTIPKVTPVTAKVQNGAVAGTVMESGELTGVYSGASETVPKHIYTRFLIRARN